MHVHIKPTLMPLPQTPPAAGAARPSATRRTDLDALLALSKDRRGGTPEPSRALTVALTELLLDATFHRDDAAGR